MQAETITTPQQKRKKLQERWTSLKSERNAVDKRCRDVARYVLPMSGKFLVSDRNRGTRQYHDILDNTGTRALKTLASGLMAGATSPARPWFRLMPADPDLAEFQPVREWLDAVGRKMMTVFQRSNTYRTLPQLYEELAAFGTAASIVLPDFENVIHHYPLTWGEFAIAQDHKGQVISLYREFERTVAEVVAEFGYANCSQNTRLRYDRRELDAWVPVVHAIEPRTERDPWRADGANMPWRSIYFETTGEDNTILRESGFQRFPVLCPRWATVGGDIYGNSPAMEALGDIRQLQQQQREKGKAIAHQADPAVQAPTSLKNQERDFLPGGVTFVDSPGQTAGVRNAFEVPLRLDYLLMDMQDCRERIRGAFYADLFRMLEGSINDKRMTATEIAERHEEKLLMLGPVLERLHHELLDPLVDLTFARLLEVGALPPPPQEMLGAELRVEFVSMLAQAQKAIGVNSVDRLMGHVTVLMGMKTDVVDTIDFDASVREYADLMGVNPNLIRDEKDVARDREARNRAQAAERQMLMLQAAAGTAKDLGNTPASGNTALGLVTQPVQPAPV